MIAEPVTVRLELESHPENVALVRSALTGLAEALELEDELVSDLKTALSEACNNVALHAYDDGAGSGPMIVEIRTDGAGIGAAVIDRGSGINRISGGEDRMGLGLAVISALASASEFRHPEAGGTEVRMWFAKPGAAQSLAGGLSQHHFQTGTSPGRSDNQILLSFTPVGVLRYVLGRMVQSLAAASHFSITRLSHLRGVNEAIAGYIESAADGQGTVELAISVNPQRLELTTGRLPDYDPESARAALDPVVDKLSMDRETLQFELLDSSR